MGAVTMSPLRRQPGTQPTICVVDDDPSVLRALGRLLRSAGFRVETFASSEAFLQSPRGAIHCLVLDIRLGGMSGLGLLEHLTAAGEVIPVIFMTAHDDATTQGHAERAGAVAYLRKPFADQLLIGAIQRALERAP